MTKAFLSLGSNVGDRKTNIEAAISSLRELCTVVSISPLYETHPVGVADKELFLNCVIELDVQLGPTTLLSRILAIEKALGREQREGPRTIDIDILLYDQYVIEQEDLRVPHPRMHERLFVLAPMRDIAPDVQHPLLMKSMQELAEQSTGSQIVSLFE